MCLPDINSLRLLISLPTPLEEFIVAGYYASGDGGGGTFTWVPNPPSPALPLSNDDGIVIWPDQYVSGNPNPLYGIGYFKRIFSGAINVRWFGAKGDGSTDDTAAVHLARDAAGVGTIYFPQSIDQWGAPLSYKGAFVFHPSVSM